MRTERSHATFLSCDKLRREERFKPRAEACRPRRLNPDQENNNAAVPGVNLMLATHSLPQVPFEMHFSFHLSASISVSSCLVLSPPTDDVQRHQHIPQL